ncbi:hypothetical protein G7046_g529 [Stylonectria norvegica]|nr:hypothetical protein G7046_g529 [Stylonectria norvegica]
MAGISIVLLPREWPISLHVFFFFLAVTLTLAFRGILTAPSFPRAAPTMLCGRPVVGSLAFFNSRGEFLRKWRLRSPDQQFSFYYGPHPIVALGGLEAISTFYGHRGLDFSEGYSNLLGAVPNVRFLHKGLSSFFVNKVKRFMNKDHLAGNLHHLIEDTSSELSSIERAPSTIVDPFNSMWRLVYRLTHRTLGFHEIADDAKLLDKTLAIYSGLDDGSALDIMFPLLPTWTKAKKMWAIASLFFLFRKIVSRRRYSSSPPKNDTIETLIKQGADDAKISVFVIATLFAGVINSGVNAAWVLVFLRQNSDWYGYVRSEVNEVLAKYRTSGSDSLKDIFHRLTLEQWESEFPMIHLCLRESMRLNQPGSTIRKNTSGKDIPIGSTGKVIPDGMYAVYQPDQVHLNPSIYTDPLKWDPERHLPGREEDKKEPNAFLGWGTGLHPCLGQRFAKLEITVTTAMFIANFDYELCDDIGSATPAPPIDRNAFGAKTPKNPVYLDCRKRSRDA